MSPTVVISVGVLAGFVLLARRRRIPVVTASTLVSVSVVIPARNEASSLPALLGTLRTQTLVPHEVIVVDDGSTDPTASLAIEGGARLLSAPPPENGWLGKPWACQLGAAEADGEVLVFLDADVILEPTGLARVVEAHQSLAPDGVLSVQPFHRTRRVYEQFSLYPNIVMMMASGHFAAARSLATPLAFGPCVVASVEAYRAVGGHAAVAGEVLEDMHLGRAFARAGRTVRCLAGDGAVSFRMYPDGVRQLVEGWTKNLAGGTVLVRPLALLLAVWWVTASAAAAIGGIGWALRMATGRPASWLAPLLWWLVAAQVAVFARRVGSFRWWVGPFFVVPLAGFLMLMVRSAAHRTIRRRVMWRGRVIPVGQS